MHFIFPTSLSFAWTPNPLSYSASPTHPEGSAFEVSALTVPGLESSSFRRCWLQTGGLCWPPHRKSQMIPTIRPQPASSPCTWLFQRASHHLALDMYHFLVHCQTPFPNASHLDTRIYTPWGQELGFLHCWTLVLRTLLSTCLLN